MLVLSWCGLGGCPEQVVLSRSSVVRMGWTSTVNARSCLLRVVWDATGFRVPGRVEEVWGRGPFLLADLVSLQLDGAKISWCGIQDAGDRCHSEWGC